MKEAPFYIGQKVVALKTGIDIKKGDVYTVGELIFCCNWKVVLKASRPEEVMCSNCGKVHYKLIIRAIHFAPIEEAHYEDVTKELAKLPQDEVPDVKKVKELVN